MRKLFKFLPCLAILLWIPLWAELAVPLAPEHPDTTFVHGAALVDDWAWLRDTENPELPAVLAAEDAYARACLKPSKKLARKLYDELAGGGWAEGISYPRLRDGYFYYVKEPANKIYSMHYRIANTPGAKEQLILDENELARGHHFFSLDLFTVSRDTRKLAYSLSFEGNEEYLLYVKDLPSGATRSTPVQNVSQAIWLDDCRNMLVTTTNSVFQTDTAWLLDTQTGEQRQIYKEPDPDFNLTIYPSADRSLIFVMSSNANTDQVWYLQAAAAEPVLVPLYDRRENRKAIPDHVNGIFYVESNEFHPDSSLYYFPDGASPQDSLRMLVPGRDSEPIVSSAFFRDTVAVLRRHEGFKRIELYDLPSGNLRRIIAASAPEDIGIWSESDPQADSLVYYAESELASYALIRHDIFSGREQTVHPGLDDDETDYSDYRIDLLYVTATDGAKIPLRLIYKRDLDPRKPHPLWLYGYGAYGDCEDPYNWSSLFSLLDRGFIYAVAHVRGGGELGEAWYEGGRTQHKRNTFSDFIACMDFLIANGYTVSDSLVIEGGSAGGLLIGAVLNLAPQKLRLAIADVPFVDLVNTMLDPQLPLTLQEYEEWGDPNNDADFKYMLSYSPYDNVHPAVYPDLLVSAGWDDVRVGYWESLKWVQKLRRNNLGPHKMVYLLHREEGHLGSTDSDVSLKEHVQKLAYAMYLLGIRK